MVTLQSLTRQDLEELLFPVGRIKFKRNEVYSEEEEQKRRAKKARYRAKQIFNWVYQRYVDDWDQMTDLSHEFKAWLKENIQIYKIKKAHEHLSLDGTRKYLWSLEDDKTIESVIIPVAKDGKPSPTYKGVAVSLEDADQAWNQYWDRQTLCISSQVGCAMKCKFCLTGIQGLDRHLQTYEIVTQVLEVKKRANLTNIVFMGMGEPLHNLENVLKACQIFTDQEAFNFSKRKVTVSTSGIVPAIKKLGETVDVSLAISLNGSNDEQRSYVMPVNQRWNIAELLKACREYPIGSQRKITFEYVLIKDVNDSVEDARRVGKLLKNMKVLVNIIPLNEHPGSDFKRPSDLAVRAFYETLMRMGIRATVRISRGQDILAACGQLRSMFDTARGTNKHRDYTETALASR